MLNGATAGWNGQPHCMSDPPQAGTIFGHPRSLGGASPSSELLVTTPQSPAVVSRTAASSHPPSLWRRRFAMLFDIDPMILTTL
ncbi:hypothetical protein J7T55_007988 [Diaporthe amygdali]|uniref:uncharacterized protein n=1 Tax=Phomopsis amygdali TaxID=1214568 RepID=UPI0022FE36B8|nr:uncharacterized protein J7T55_007988 [Diaporthe amygdali]KAJ0114154.1 hypothetical protein J7T55_007988 [Diaporthe amygdali]